MSVAQKLEVSPLPSPRPPGWEAIPAARLRGIILLASHFTLDAYAALVPVLLGLLEVRCRLSPHQLPWVLAITPLVAGLSQPVFAWLSDRFDTRVFAAGGMVLVSVALCLMGMAGNFGSLMLFVACGYLGAGIFHPIAASSMGQLSQQRRGVGMSAFFVAGMLGGVSGSFLAPRIVAGTNAFTNLRWWMIPGLLVAILLHFAIRNLPHREPHYLKVKFAPPEIAARWRMIMLLYVTCAMRAMVYTTMQYLYVRWAQARTALEHSTWTAEQLAEAAAPLVGNLNAATIAGMGLGGLGAGLIRQDREKLPLVLVPLLFSPAILFFPHATTQIGYVLGLLAGVGFAATIPMSLTVAQRLLPHRTSMASALVMGGTWAVAALGPCVAEWGLTHFGLAPVFYVAALALATSGVLGVRLQVSTEPPQTGLA